MSFLSRQLQGSFRTFTLLFLMILLTICLASHLTNAVYLDAKLDVDNLDFSSHKQLMNLFSSKGLYLTAICPLLFWCCFKESRSLIYRTSPPIHAPPA